MKPLVIYHANCADGFGAAFAAWLKFGDEAEYLPMQYNQPHVADYNGRELYILDFSFHKEMMDYVFAHAKRVVWLDHHKTAFEMWHGPLNGLPFFEQDIETKEVREHPTDCHYILLHQEKSGAMLAWEYFHPAAEVPMLIKHIDDYDRWQFKLEGTKEINKALWSYAPWSFEKWEWFKEECRRTLEDNRLFETGKAILRAHDANVQAVVKGAARECNLWSEVGGFAVGLAANCPPHLASDVGHQLANQSGTYGLLWSVNREGKCICSLRSNGGYDVSAIAKGFGGGGHKNAAGFEVAIEQLLSWINVGDNQS